MALPGSGAIALSDIADEFGGSTPHSMSEYYSGGLGPSEVPASGAISFSDFYGTSSVPDWAGSRSMYAGGYTTAYSNVVQTKTVASTSNLTDYGDLVYGRGTHGSLSSQTYMFSAGGYGASGASNMIDRKVFASNANATDRADLQSETQYNNPSGVSNGSRGCWGHGYQTWLSNNSPNYGYIRNIKYMTLPDGTYASNFGILNSYRSSSSGHGGDTRGVWGGGQAHQNVPGGSGKIDAIDYITIATTGNATDFGDLAATTAYLGSCGSTTRIVFGGGVDNTNYSINTLQYITVASTGNTTDFGDFYSAIKYYNIQGCGDGSKGEFMGGWTNWPNGRTNRTHYITISSTGNSNANGECASGI